MRFDTAIAARLVSSGINTGECPPELRPVTPVFIKIGGRALADTKLVALGEHGGTREGDSRVVCGG